MKGVFYLARLLRISADDDLSGLDWKFLLSDFLRLKRAQKVSDHTLNDYQQHVSLFFRRFPNAPDSFDELKNSCFAHLSEEIAASTYNNRLVYLRSFLDHCVEESELSSNPLAGIKKKKTTGRKVDIDVDVLKKLLTLPDQGSFAGLRDYTLILLTYDTGIRPSEAFRLIPEDFREKESELYIPEETAKSRTFRRLPLSPKTVKAIKRLIHVRPSEWGSSVPIFCTYEGKHLTRHTWGDRMEMYCNKLGVHIRPYDLRHSFALNFLRGNGNVFALKDLLGHTTLKMTENYVNLANQDLKHQHAEATPLHRLAPDVKRVNKI